MKKIIYYSLVVIALFTACNKDENLTEQDLTQDSEIDEMLNVLEKAGYNKDSITVGSNYFVIEGDMTVSFEDIPLWKNELDEPKLKSYSYDSYYASLNSVRDIAVYFQSSVSENDWYDACISAMSDWNDIEHCAVNFYQTTSSSSADIVISTFYEYSTSVALGNLPSDGNVGEYVKINTKYNSYSDLYKENTIAHELGHTIGFAHSGGISTYANSVISGTSTSESSADVMYRYTHSWYGFSDDELDATDVLFHEFIAFSLTGTTSLNITSLKPGSSFTYRASFGSYNESNLTWKLTQNNVTRTLTDTDSNIKLYAVYSSGSIDGSTQEVKVEASCSDPYLYDALIITLKDGYYLSTTYGTLPRE